MDLHDAYHTLKESLDCGNGSKEAHAHAVNNANEYRTVYSGARRTCPPVLQCDTSLRRGKIVDLPGSEMCEDLGKVAIETINSIRVVNQCTEEMAAVKIACDETSGMSYL